MATNDAGEVSQGLDGFPERLRDVIARSGAPSLHAYAQQSGVPDTALRKYLAGTSRPSVESLLAIALFSSVSLDWLVIGEGRWSKEPPEESEFLEVVEFAARLALQDALEPPDRARVNRLARRVAEHATAFYFAGRESERDAVTRGSLVRGSLKAASEYLEVLQRRREAE